MRVIGLTGSIGMGKSTAAGIFRRAGIPVFDADAEVHRLQRPGGAAVALIQKRFPGAVTDHAVDRAALRDAVLTDTEALKALERIMHPLVRQSCRRFLAAQRRGGRRLAVLDIPLLFETGADRGVDLIVVVTAPPSVQRYRLRRRGLLSDHQVSSILRAQMSDSEKRRRSDHLIKTGLSRHHAHAQTRKLISRYR